jgi:hypothetical protein
MVTLDGWSKVPCSKGAVNLMRAQAREIMGGKGDWDEDDDSFQIGQREACFWPGLAGAKS